jgi:hypothetical protein
MPSSGLIICDHVGIFPFDAAFCLCVTQHSLSKDKKNKKGIENPLNGDIAFV